MSYALFRDIVSYRKNTAMFKDKLELSGEPVTLDNVPNGRFRKRFHFR